MIIASACRVSINWHAVCQWFRNRIAWTNQRCRTLSCAAHPPLAKDIPLRFVEFGRRTVSVLWGADRSLRRPTWSDDSNVIEKMDWDVKQVSQCLNETESDVPAEQPAVPEHYVNASFLFFCYCQWCNHTQQFTKFHDRRTKWLVFVWTRCHRETSVLCDDCWNSCWHWHSPAPPIEKSPLTALNTMYLETRLTIECHVGRGLGQVQWSLLNASLSWTVISPSC